MASVVLCFVILGLTVVLADQHRAPSRPILAYRRTGNGLTNTCIDGCETECASLTTCAKNSCMRTCRPAHIAGGEKRRCMMKCMFVTCLNDAPACKTCSAPCMERIQSCTEAHCVTECPAGQTVSEHLSSAPCRTCVLRKCPQGNTDA